MRIWPLAPGPWPLTVTITMALAAAPAANASFPVDDAMQAVLTQQRLACDLPTRDLVRAGGTFRYIGLAEDVFPGHAPVRLDDSSDSALLDTASDEHQTAHPARMVPDGNPWQAFGPARTVDKCGYVWERIGPGHGASPVLTGETADAPEPSGQVCEHEQSDGDVDITRMSWKYACHHAHFEHESRAEVTTYANRAQRSTVLIHTFVINLGPPYTVPDDLFVYSVGTCSGVLLDSTYVLTAAHCVTIENSSGTYTTPWSASNMVVCTQGNRSGYDGECTTVSSVTPNPAYYASGGSNGNINHDFAVLELDSPIAGSADTMSLATGSESDWAALNLRLVAYHSRELGVDSFSYFNPPQFYVLPTCNENVDERRIESMPHPTLPTLTLPLRARRAYFEIRSGSDTSFTSNQVRTRFDASSGSSGAPFFYCPSNNCNNVPRIIGVNSLYYPSGSHRQRGPKVNTFQSFVAQHAP